MEFPSVVSVYVSVAIAVPRDKKNLAGIRLNRNIGAAAQDVQAAIAQATRQLPQNMPTPPTCRKVNPADQPILYIALTGPTLPVWKLDECAETDMAQRISTVSGVAQVQVFGSQKCAVRVQVDPDALPSRQIGLDEVGAGGGARARGLQMI